MSSSKLDVVIFGASGYTGKYTVYEATKVLAGLTWGVAGRSREKLERTLAEMGKKAGQDLSNLPIIIADVGDQKSLVEMAKRAKVVVNCCGPYRFSGEAVVKACIDGGANHVDVSGEPQYMENMQLKYHDEAQQKGVYIVSACGFDSIPADVGLNFFEKEFDGTVNQVETYLKSYPINNYKAKGAKLNYGTYESAIYGVCHSDELKGLRRKLYPGRMPRFNPSLLERSTMHKAEVLNNKWCLPFLGSDRSVVYRSQRHMYEVEKKRPVQMKAYVSFPGFLSAFATLIGMIVFAIMTKVSFTRRLLLNHPKFFTFGAVSKDGPEEKTNENVKFEFTFTGEGWIEKFEDPDHAFETKPNKFLVTRVSAINPGYGATCVAILISALTILKESDKMPSTGGVLPPGAAFRNTDIVENLSKHGYTFEVLKKYIKP